MEHTVSRILNGDVGKDLNDWSIRAGLGLWEKYARS